MAQEEQQKLNGVVERCLAKMEVDSRERPFLAAWIGTCVRLVLERWSRSKRKQTALDNNLYLMSEFSSTVLLLLLLLPVLFLFPPGAWQVQVIQAGTLCPSIPGTSARTSTGFFRSTSGWSPRCWRPIWSSGIIRGRSRRLWRRWPKLGRKRGAWQAVLAAWKRAGTHGTEPLILYIYTLFSRRP